MTVIADADLDGLTDAFEEGFGGDIEVTVPPGNAVSTSGSNEDPGGSTITSTPSATDSSERSRTRGATMTLISRWA